MKDPNFFIPENVDEFEELAISIAEGDVAMPKDASQELIEKVEEFRFGETSLSEMRVDEQTEENNAEQILSNTKNKKEDFFVVPKIVE